MGTNTGTRVQTVDPARLDVLPFAVDPSVDPVLDMLAQPKVFNAARLDRSVTLATERLPRPRAAERATVRV